MSGLPAASDVGDIEAIIARTSRSSQPGRISPRVSNPKAITSRYDGTALIAAAHLGHAEVVRTLIAAKAPLDHVNNLR